MPRYAEGQLKRCRARFLKYRYDAESKLCVQFIYGGCGGTDNRFETLRECANFCGSKNDLTPPRKFELD